MSNALNVTETSKSMNYIIHIEYISIMSAPEETMFLVFPVFDACNSYIKLFIISKAGFFKHSLETVNGLPFAFIDGHGKP